MVTAACSVAMLLAASRAPYVREVVAAPTNAHFQDPARVDENTASADTSGFTGRLDREIDYYKTHGRDLYAAMNGKPWYGHQRPRSCTDCPEGATTTLKIQAIGNTYKDRLTALPRHGVVIGRIVNVGQHTDAVMRARPRTFLRKPDQYYFIIKDRGDSLSADLYVARLSFDFLGRARQRIEILESQGKYVKCPPHGEPPRTTSDGDFKPCPSPLRMMPSRPRGGSMMRSHADPVFHFAAFDRPAVAAMRGSVDASAWFSCDAGCCTAAWPPSVKNDSTASTSMP